MWGIPKGNKRIIEMLGNRDGSSGSGVGSALLDWKEDKKRPENHGIVLVGRSIKDHCIPKP